MMNDATLSVGNLAQRMQLQIIEVVNYDLMFSLGASLPPKLKFSQKMEPSPCATKPPARPNQATKLVSDGYGVKRIVNTMTVQ